MSTGAGAEPQTKYAHKLPGGLRRALVAGRWLPIVGAGLSAAATTQDGRHPPAWAGMAAGLAADVPGVARGSPIDVITAYSETYGRAQLIERLAEVLFVRHIQPGGVHCAFAKLPFDTIVTTNIDFLLERAYEEERRPCEPLLGESQLSIGRSREATYLLKFHGDLRHPDDLIVTEDDYDGFLRRNPLLATYMAWWLLTREPVFIGYSLDDADLREVLTLLRERLGRMTRPTWAILAADPNGEAPKFNRRGVKPIVLDDDPNVDRATVLETFFIELRAMWEHEIAPRLEARTDATTAELRRPRIAPQTALIVASPSVMALYRDYVFSSVPRTGLLPMAIDDVHSPDPAMRPMAVDIALSKAEVVVYDSNRENPLPADYVISRRGAAPLVTVYGSDPLPTVLLGRDSLRRPAEMGQWPEKFVAPLVQRIQQAKSPTDPVAVAEELERLASAQKHEPLLLTQLALLEEWMRTIEIQLTTITHSGGRMELLRDRFDTDYDTMVQAVRLRHDLMRNLNVPVSELRSCTDALADVIVRKVGQSLDSQDATAGSADVGKANVTRLIQDTPAEAEPAGASGGSP